ncbi:unnamed protein product [Ilex paraguariensis]|uniref:Uncharacterized protein n=1 Tax=Ilex paraguariensis TaxID=185542 RepID=A0ABC8R5H5_9AQUA
MEFLSLQHQPLSSDPNFMNPISCKLTPTLRIISTKFRLFSTSSPNLTTTQTPIREENCIKTSLSGNTRVKAKVLDTQLKENWLDSLTCPFPEKLLRSDRDSNGQPSNEKSGWVMGIDPDVHGALAVLKTDCSGCSAQVRKDQDKLGFEMVGKDVTACALRKEGIFVAKVK